MTKNKKLVIVGAGEFGEIAFEYFMKDSEYEVVAFAVEQAYRKIDELRELPVVDLETLEQAYPPSEYETFVAVTYVKLNRARRRLYNIVKAKGYTCASYISSHAFFWDNATVGENTFIFEDNTIQYHVQIGNNCILWSGNHVGHRTVIEDDVWLTSHDVISGFCHIGRGCFIGVNASVGDNVTIADDIVLGIGAGTVKDLTQKAGVYIGLPAKPMEGRTAYQQFQVEANEIDWEA